MKKNLSIKIKLYFCLALMIATSFMPAMVFATDKSQFYSLNDILFYDENASGCVDASGTSAGSSFNSTLVAIGDSLMVRAERTGDFSTKLKSDNGYTDVTVDAQVSRFIYAGGVGSTADPSSSGLEAVDDNSAKITAAGTIIIELGTNHDAKFDEGVPELMKKVRALNKTARVFWVNTANTSAPAGADAANASIAKYSTDPQYNYSVIDWHDEVYNGGTADATLLDSTGYHQSPTGVTRYVALILSVIGKYTAPSSGGTSGYSGTAEQNLEAILKYLTSKGLTLAAAAGIAGNIDRETGGTFDPTILQGGGHATSEADIDPTGKGKAFGIIQWDGGRKKNLINYAHSVGSTALDFQTQLDFMWQREIIEKGDGNHQALIDMLDSVESDTPYKGIVPPEIAAAIMWNGTNKDMLTEGNLYVNTVGYIYGSERSSSDAKGLVEVRGKAATGIFNTYRGQIADGTGIVGANASPTSNVGSYDCDEAPGAQSGNIVQTALSLAWPEPVLDEVDAVKAFTPKPEYIAAREKYNKVSGPVDYTDCGQFVATVMIMSGADPNYVKSGTGRQRQDLIDRPDKYTVTYNPKVSDLAPGDILVYRDEAAGRGHTLIYYGDATYQVIEAARDTRVPSVQKTGANYILKNSSAISARLIK